MKHLLTTLSTRILGEAEIIYDFGMEQFYRQKVAIATDKSANEKSTAFPHIVV